MNAYLIFIESVGEEDQQEGPGYVGERRGRVQ